VIEMPTHEIPQSAARSPDDGAVEVAAESAAKALRNGPTGAFAVGLLLIGWLAFYFFLFIPRGAGG
jgi:hypothetical protein